MNYKVSVIIPTYNAENFLLNAVNSIMNQTMDFNEIELILIDDQSTDRTKEILNELSCKYENIKAIFLDENSGSPSKPRNIGVKEAKSDYIMFLDNDDSYCEDFCEKMHETIIKYNADIVTCRNYDIINGKTSKYHSILDKKDKLIELNSIEEDDTLISTTSMLIWNKIYKKDLLVKNQIEFPTGMLYEDVNFNLQAYINAERIIFLNDYYGYKYNIRLDENNKSTSQDFKKENLGKFSKGLSKIFKILEKEKKHYKNFESEMLVGFAKWIILTDCDLDYKLKLFEQFKDHYTKYELFQRLEHIPLFKNIIINLGIKFFCLNKNFLKITLMIKSRII